MGDRLRGKVALVTGAASGIGRAIALRFAREGASVVIADITEEVREGGEPTRAVLEREGHPVLFQETDVADEAAAGRAVAAAVERFGRLDILVNNAAIRREVPFAELDFASWRAVLDVCLDGAFHCARAALPALRDSRQGTIVNIGGLTGHSGAANRAHVVTAKAGLAGFTRALAHDLAPDGITVNLVAPGLIDTAREPTRPHHRGGRRTLVGREGTPEEVAAAVRFLAGPRARYITGQTLHVNGGAYLPG